MRDDAIRHEKTATAAKRPVSSVCCRLRLHHTLLDEHIRVAGRTTWYESVEQMQSDLDRYLHQYNHERPHQGRMMKGRTPIQPFLAGITEQPPETLPEAT